MLSAEEISEAIKESPLFQKWGEDEDIIKAIQRFGITNTKSQDVTGEVYAG
ncbi:MAG: hypothetical protein ABSB95_11275 [Dissulfurispiraceae bacterium]|jgi:hypothetical protein